MEKLYHNLITERHHTNLHLPSEPSETRSDAWRQARDLQLAHVYKGTVEAPALLAHRTRSLPRAATRAVFLVDESHPCNLVAKVAVGRSQEILKGAVARIGGGVTVKAASKASAYAGNFDLNDITPGLGVRMNPEFKSCAVATSSLFFYRAFRRKRPR